MRSGRELWRADLPASGHATPITYRGARSGRQFVVIAAGGGGRFSKAISDAFVAFALPSQSAPQSDAGFAPLFDGRTLDGWVNVNCAPDTWTVRDGMIYSTGKPICELRTAKMYENFVLELEYQHLDKEGNAGVFIWGDAITARGQPFVRAIEVQILDGRNTENYTSHGDVFAIHGARMTPDRPHPGGWMRSLPTERRGRPAGEWNHYRITAQNGTIKLAVNGKEVSGGYDVSPRKGYIHLESEGGRVLYRNLRIKELPPAATLAPDQIARADEGFVSLYTGLNFNGWEVPSGHEGHWVSKDWTIAYDGRSSAANKDLSSERRYGDVSVIADWRWMDDAAATTVALPIAFGGVEWPDGVRSSIARALAGTAKEQWRRAQLTKRQGRLTILIDGETIVNDVPAPGADRPSPIVLKHDGPSSRVCEHLCQFAEHLTSGTEVRPCSRWFSVAALTTTFRTITGEPAA